MNVDAQIRNWFNRLPVIAAGIAVWLMSFFIYKSNLFLAILVFISGLIILIFNNTMVSIARSVFNNNQHKGEYFIAGAVLITIGAIPAFFNSQLDSSKFIEFNLYAGHMMDTKIAKCLLEYSTNLLQGIGIGLFVASFMIPDKSNSTTQTDSSPSSPPPLP